VQESCFDSEKTFRTRSPKTADAERNRERILDIAEDAFTQFGAETSLDDIAWSACQT
jgi:AcrR family transcriptional regulator